MVKGGGKNPRNGKKKGAFPTRGKRRDFFSPEKERICPSSVKSRGVDTLLSRGRMVIPREVQKKKKKKKPNTPPPKKKKKKKKKNHTPPKKKRKKNPCSPLRVRTMFFSPRDFPPGEKEGFHGGGVFYLKRVLHWGRQSERK